MERNTAGRSGQEAPEGRQTAGPSLMGEGRWVRGGGEGRGGSLATPQKTRVRYLTTDRRVQTFLQADSGLIILAKGVFYDVLQAVQVPDGDGAPGRESSGILAAGLLNRRTEKHEMCFIYD